MPSTRELYDLVHALSPQEQRYFKLFAKAISGKQKTAYLEHFNKIHALKTFDSDSWKYKVGKGKTAKALADLNEYLYRKIIRALANFHAEAKQHSDLLQQLQEAEVLYAKGLYANAIKILQVLKNDALYVEAYHIVHRSHFLETLIFGLTGKILRDKNLKSNLEKASIEYLRSHETLIRYEQLLTELNIMRKECSSIRNNDQLQRYLEFLKHPLLSDKERPSGSMALYYYYCIKIILLNNSFQKKKALEFCKECVTFLEQIKESHPLKNNYFGFLNLFCEINIELEQYEVYFKNRSQFLSMQPESKEGGRYSQLFENLELYYAVKSKDWKEGFEFVNQIGTELRQINTNSLTNLYRKAVILYYNNQLDEAQSLLQTIIDHKESVRQNILVATRLFLLIIFFDKKETLLLPYAVRSAHRSLLKSEQLFKGERIIMQFLRKRIDLNNEKEWKNVFSELLQQFQTIKQDQFEAHFFNHFDYIYWLKAKTNRV